MTRQTGHPAGSAGLERGYRRLLACYPRAFRQASEDEIIAVLLDSSADGQQRVGLAESVDLLRGAVRMHLGASRSPRALLAAIRLMCVGTALELAAWIVTLLTAGQVRSGLLARHPGLTAALGQAALAHLTAIEVAGPAAAAGWLVLAWAAGRGDDWARPAFMALFGLYTASLLFDLAAHAVAWDPVGLAAVAVLWLVALAVMVLIFSPAAGRYCRPETARQ
jgi:hypothetical protein